VATASVIMWT